jgi:hypothetical protein
MSERERWIVYPLLMFALGAALRDKFTQEVRTDRLHAGRIACEELVVYDSEKPDRPVAKLSSNPPQRNSPSADRYGVFVLIDSENKELCGVTNNQLQINQIASKNIVAQTLTVVDPHNPAHPLAQLGAAPVRQPDGTTRSIGRLLLTDADGKEYFGLADDQLMMRRLVCEGIAVVDPANPQRTVAGLASIAAPSDDGGEPQRQGVLLLNDRPYASLMGTPPRAPAARDEKDSRSEAPSPSPPQAEKDA